MERRSARGIYDLLKRLLDIIGAAIALILAAPILVAATVLIKLDGGPVLFVRKCVGLKGKPFGMLKLRTMVPNAHKLESTLRQEHATNGGYGVPGEYSDPRITRVGRILRRLNLDELPQFINVFKGEMSLVGPRPVPYNESLLFGDRRLDVLSVKPGITGYWQVKRSMSMDYDKRVELDCYYAMNRSFLLDAYILLMTPISLLTSDYNSVTKPLPPPTEGVLISDRAISPRERRRFVQHQEKILESRVEESV